MEAFSRRAVRRSIAPPPPPHTQANNFANLSRIDLGGTGDPHATSASLESELARLSNNADGIVKA